MKNNENRIAAAAFIGLVMVALILALGKAGYAHGQDQPAAPTADEIKLAAMAQSHAAGLAPCIVKDTATDSPGTNNVTRIVTITAEVGGSAPLVLQWQVDHGHGFESIAGATNPVFRIGNAQIADSGLYSLFATNAAGQLHTTPVPLVVIEVED